LPAETRGKQHSVGRLAARNRDHCVFALALLGCGFETNCVACMTPSPIGVGTETR
jgi:hypothetical protein